MARSPKRDYTKAWLSFMDQLQKLESRGLHIPDRAAAADFLSHINYYRFTGYCLAFQIDGSQFRPGVQFDDVRYACDFDASLRSLVGDWLQLAELDLRTQTCHFITERYGAFGHCDAANFSQRFSKRVTHAHWLDRLQKETKQASRLWERLHQIKPVLPDEPLWKPPHLTDNSRLFCTLLLLRKLTQRSPTAKKASDRFRDKVAKLLNSPPSVADPAQRMGLPVDWENHPVWT